MDIALLVGLSILLGLVVAANALIYSYYIYHKHTLFTKAKVEIMWITICVIFAIVLIAAGVFFTVDLNNWQSSVELDPAFIGLSFACCAFFIYFIICLIVIPKKVNKNKIDYQNILNVDYQSRINALGDVEKCKKQLAQKHKKYYNNMLISYENILKKVKNEKISLPDKIADIVIFNDTFTHKWCGQTNDYQLLLTYQFLLLMQKFPQK